MCWPTARLWVQLVIAPMLVPATVHCAPHCPCALCCPLCMHFAPCLLPCWLTEAAAAAMHVLLVLVTVTACMLLAGCLLSLALQCTYVPVCEQPHVGPCTIQRAHCTMHKHTHTCCVYVPCLCVACKCASAAFVLQADTAQSQGLLCGQQVLTTGHLLACCWLCSVYCMHGCHLHCATLAVCHSAVTCCHL